MGKIERLNVGITALGKVVQHLGVIYAGLNHQALGAAVIQKKVVRDRGHPGSDIGLPTKCSFTDQYVPATVKVTGIVISADAILLGPVGLEITEGLTVDTADQRHDAGGLERAFQPLAMLFQIPLLFPEMGDDRVVHPAVEALQIKFQVKHSKAQGGIQPGNMALIYRAAGARRAARVSFSVLQDGLLRIGAHAR